jgi:hypothetical protein
MTTRDDGSPGSHPHADRRNWQPATTFEDYLRNVREGLEPLSERRAAKLMGVRRIEVYRWRLMAELPDDLFEALLSAGAVSSSKALAQIALALKRDDPFAGEDETCPHCGGLLRRRSHISGAARAVILKWFADRDRDADPAEVAAATPRL